MRPGILGISLVFLGINEAATIDYIVDNPEFLAVVHVFIPEWIAQRVGPSRRRKWRNVFNVGEEVDFQC